jgi:transposase
MRGGFARTTISGARAATGTSHARRRKLWGRRKTDVARYGQRYKDRIVARLLPPGSSAIDVVSREVGISLATLERWRAEALANGSGAGAGGNGWTAAARLQAVIAAAAMDEATRSAWCRELGLYSAELDAWKRDAIAGLGEPAGGQCRGAREDRRRVKELERQLQRKDKALAETAALLVLSKKLSSVFHDGEDDPEPRSTFKLGDTSC